MQTRLLFATNNEHKIREIRAAIPPSIEVIGLKQAGIDIDIPEPYETLEENARAKSRTIFDLTGISCFSEDTGLEVNALGGAPGVRSARYAGPGRSSEENIDKLLVELEQQENRRANFRTVISLIWDRKEFLFEGICEGAILYARKGSGGFGYDSVFVPDGAERTFGEMNLEEKNEFSHRKKAAAKLVLFLQNLGKPAAKN